MRKYLLFLLVPLALSAADTVALAHRVHPRATPENDRGPVAPGMPIEGVTLLLKLAPGVDAFLAAQQLPGSPEYHHWLTPEQFGDRFGLSPNDLAKVTGWLESRGLQIDRVARGRHWITFTGTASQVARAFRTQFHHYEIDGAMRFANTAAPEIPEALAGVVGGIVGLDDFPRFRSAPRPVPLANVTGGGHALSPDDFATIYNVSPLYAAGINGAGQRIAIVGESALDLTDVRSFRRTFNLPASDPDRIVVGRDPGITSAAIEALADIQVAGGIARNAQIVYVYAASAFNAIAYAADVNVAPIISVSFAGCEAENDLSFRVVAQQANAQGITILAGSGDWGAATCDQFSPTPQASKGVSIAFPASMPEVTAVGGTQFNEGSGRYWNTTQTLTLGSAISYIPESAWNDMGLFNSLKISTGGGPSAVFPKPYWQSAPGVPDDHARDLPDLSLNAAYLHDGYLIVYQGTLAIFGGTSASTPAFAGVMALLNQSLANRGALPKPGLGNINPALYRLARNAPDAFHDITSGNNSIPCAQGTPACVEGQIGFSAGPGYDLATGLGTIDVQRMVTAWDAGTASTTTLAADPGKAAVGDKVTLTATVSGGGGATPTGAVTFFVFNGLAAAIGSADLTPAAEGATATLTVEASAVIGGDGMVTALYGGDSSNSASSGTVTVGVNPPASGSMVVPFIAPVPSVQVPGQGLWPLKIVLTEKAGVATTLTSFTFNGSSQSLALFSGTAIPANGAITAILSVGNLVAPSTIALRFGGRDASGATWTRDVSQQFVGSPSALQAPGISLASSPASVAMNTQADPSCQWSHQLVLRETGGFLTQITSLRQGATDLTPTLQQLFGTTRLAPYGSLTANICTAGSAGTGLRTFSVTGTTEVNAAVSATVGVPYASAAASPAPLTVTPAAITLTESDPAATLSVKSAAPWTVSVLPAKPDWLTVSSSADTITLSASAAGLSRGAWTVKLIVESPTSRPQTVSVPLTLVVGASSATTIAGVANGASFATSFAPGMVLSAFGSQLAPRIQAASGLPLPLTLAGVSATVNGVSAPLYFISPGQVNLQVPYETTLGPAVLAVNNNGQVVVFSFDVAVAAPGIFAAADGGLAPNPAGDRGQTLLAFITGDGDLTPTLATGATPPATTALARLPKPRLPASISVGGVDAPIAFVGVPPGLSGVTQINFVVPDAAPSGDQPVVVTVGGISSKAAKLRIP